MTKIKDGNNGYLRKFELFLLADATPTMFRNCHSTASSGTWDARCRITSMPSPWPAKRTRDLRSISTCRWNACELTMNRKRRWKREPTYHPNLPTIFTLKAFSTWARCSPKQETSTPRRCSCVEEKIDLGHQATSASWTARHTRFETLCTTPDDKATQSEE